MNANVQLLRFIVAGDTVNIMHKDIKMDNVFVVNTHDTESATLAVGDFGAAQRGEPTVRLGRMSPLTFEFISRSATVISNHRDKRGTGLLTPIQLPCTYAIRTQTFRYTRCPSRIEVSVRYGKTR